MQGDFRRKQAQWKVKSHFVIGQAMISAFKNINGKYKFLTINSIFNFIKNYFIIKTQL